MKRIWKAPVVFVVISFLLFACGGGERVSKEVFDEVNENMEVKRLTEAEILQEAMIWGDSITLEAQSQLISALTNAISENGTSGAVEFCNVQALPILSEVSEQYGVELRRASNRYRNPADKPKSEEEAILEAYEYNAENNIQSDPNIQKIDGGETYLYTKAIKIPSAFCLSCHGTPGTDIEDETLGMIDKLYPDDNAKGHQIGDLRGMWSLRIPKSEVVKRM